MTPADLTRWLADMKATHNFTRLECARQLGIFPSQFSRWKQKGAPVYVALACAALLEGLSPYSITKPTEGTGNADF